MTRIAYPIKVHAKRTHRTSYTRVVGGVQFINHQKNMCEIKRVKGLFTSLLIRKKCEGRFVCVLRCDVPLRLVKIHDRSGYCNPSIGATRLWRSTTDDDDALR